MKLYELSLAMQQVQELMEKEEDQTLYKDTLDSLELSLSDKVEGSIKVMKSFEAEAKAIKEEEDRLKKRRQALENKSKWMKEYISQNLTAANLKKLDAGIFKVGFRKNAPAVQINEGAEVPEGFLIPQEPKVDKTNLKKWLKDGNEVEGISLVSGESLSIR